MIKMTANQNQILYDKLSDLMISTLEFIVGEDEYAHRKVDSWDARISERCLVNLAKLGMPFKYIVTSVITSKKDGYEKLNVFSTCFWNNDTDFKCTVKWENKTVMCILSVYALALN
ncbi:GSCOCG00001094001-RA-CDS [Cotesia congregata]|uniref:Similar to Dlc90F: Dynein light chain Tctex-type (Drosophila melanogaster) n=1 Tax=Cotesia congregata TaxID=51543 RepID=A0A8J2HHY1_COTCN|nr:GSCOCG00001094001-RA-CDS [Cotesia congregata]CAG5096123.1 Similar to Dlc90F: Dynein light chain Tctex-type (Drosophila melanogaster) [Cotesia congregata]